jgi:NAD(P)-dependent dehydrogenase (short-subunit alcohol dehydrogenase family)
MNLPLNIDYSGKVVVVTGAGGLICGAMARAFAQSGAKVAALDLNEDERRAVLYDNAARFLGL